MTNSLKGCGEKVASVLYISAWHSGPPRGGFLSAVTLLEHLKFHRPLLWVGQGVLEQARAVTRVKLPLQGYRAVPSEPSWVTRGISILQDAIHCARMICDRGIDVVVTDYEVFPAAALASRLTRRACAFYLRDFPNLGRKGKLRTTVAWCRNGIFLSEAMRSAFCLSAGIKERQTGRHLLIVPNSLSPEFFSGSRSFDAIFPSKPPLLRIGIVGAICPKKNQLWFLRQVLPLLLSPDFPLTVMLFGDAAEAAYFQEVQSELDAMRGSCNVTCRGFVRDPREIYPHIDVLVQVSKNEGIARAVLEAGSFGIPTVALRSLGIEEYVHDGVTGFVVDTAEQLAARLRTLEEHPELRGQMGERARQSVGQRHAPDKVAACFETVLDAMMEGRT